MSTRRGSLPLSPTARASLCAAGVSRGENPKQPAGAPVSLRGQPSVWRPLRVCPPARLAGRYVHALVCVVGTLPSPLSPPSNPQMCCVPGFVTGYAGHGDMCVSLLITIYYFTKSKVSRSSVTLSTYEVVRPAAWVTRARSSRPSRARPPSPLEAGRPPPLSYPSHGAAARGPEVGT